MGLLELSSIPHCSQGLAFGGFVPSPSIMVAIHEHRLKDLPVFKQHGSWGCNKNPCECSNSANPSFTPGINSSVFLLDQAPLPAQTWQKCSSSAIPTRTVLSHFNMSLGAASVLLIAFKPLFSCVWLMNPASGII